MHVRRVCAALSVFLLRQQHASCCRRPAVMLAAAGFMLTHASIHGNAWLCVVGGAFCVCVCGGVGGGSAVLQ